MKSLKIVISKVDYLVKDNTSNLPLKKRIRDKTEKENKSRKTQNDEEKGKKRSNVLQDTPVPSKKANVKKTRKKSTSSEDEESDIDLDEMFLSLKKSGVKTLESNLSSSKKSPGSVRNDKSSVKKEKSSDAKEKSSVKNERKSSVKKQSTPSSQKKIKKRLVDEFDSIAQSKDERKIERKVPELEKVVEDAVLNLKKTPVKSKQVENEETPQKNSSETPLRRSTRKRSSVFKDETVYEVKKTPVRKSISTPIKKSSVDKREVTLLKTPTTKFEKRLPTTPLEKARLSLHVSTVPDGLPCREKEFSNILTFLENKLWDGIGGCMYISGVPGTGKTATVTQVIRHLQDLSNQGKAPDFKFIEINGMRLADPRQAYVQLWQKLFDRKEKITSDRAHKFLDDWFSKSDTKNSKKTTVLLVDELDLICTKKQDVVYNLLDWPTRTHSRLVVLTIANTMDMPERLFKGRVTSRMGLTRLTFMPYTHKQLEEIVLARLKGLDAFVTDAVRLVTRKVAAVSGDARRALDICRRATELPPPDETVKICHIEQAIKEMTNSNIVKVIRSCGELEKLFLRSLSDVSFRSNVEEVDLREVIDQLLAICVLEGIPRPSISSILFVSHRLKCCRLIFANQSSAGVLQRLTLNVTQDDIHYALRVS